MEQIFEKLSLQDKKVLNNDCGLRFETTPEKKIIRKILIKL